MSVAIVGAGAWGTALGNLFCDAGCEATLWTRNEDVKKSIESQRENAKYLPGIQLSKKLSVTSKLEEALKPASWVVCAVPTQNIRSVFAKVAPLLKGKPVVSTSKGIEVGTHKRVSEIFHELAPQSPFLVLSGPSFALEVGKRLPTAVTLACRDEKLGSEFQKKIKTPYFRAYTTQDVVGVEIAGALKNVVALGTGIVDGLKLGHNAQAALINRGLAEMARAGGAFGADARTFLGLSGVGDLILTCTGPLSRNRRLGFMLAEGHAIEEAKKLLGGVAEGYYTAQSAYRLSQEKKIEMPITEQIYRILYEGGTPQKALLELMGRDLKGEWD